MILKNKFSEVIFSYPECSSIELLIKTAHSRDVPLTNLDLENTNLEEVDLSGFDLSGSLFYNANLFNANLSNCNLSNCGFFAANLRYANLKNVVAINALFNEAIMTNVFLQESELTDCEFKRTNLFGSNLKDACVVNCNFESANLSDANLQNVDFTGSSINCFGNQKNIYSMQVDTFLIGYTVDLLQIGENQHLIEDWKKFDKKQIEKMNISSEWWDKWSKTLFNTIKLSFKEDKKQI